MRDPVGGKIAGPEFARAWLAARHRTLHERERVGEKFDRTLMDVFYMLDDYVIDPSVRDPSDMADEELVGKMRGNYLFSLFLISGDAAGCGWLGRLGGRRDRLACGGWVIVS
jgi:hypothetical protein